MKMSRAGHENPAVRVAEKSLTEQDLAYCDLQGDIFMAAVDLGYVPGIFAPAFMNSQVAGVIDYSFSAGRGIEHDGLSEWLEIPVLVKSPGRIAALVMWLDHVSEKIGDGEPALAALERILGEGTPLPDPGGIPESYETLEEIYEYAYWLGYIYRCETLMHSESSRMVYGAFPEAFMREHYLKMMPGMGVYDMEKAAFEICRRLDLILSGML